MTGSIVLKLDLCKCMVFLRPVVSHGSGLMTDVSGQFYCIVLEMSLELAEGSVSHVSRLQWREKTTLKFNTTPLIDLTFCCRQVP